MAASDLAIYDEQICLEGSDLFYNYFRDRLSANDFIQIRKVQEHVYEKVLCNGSESGSNNTDKQDDRNDSFVAEDKIQLLCNDKVSITKCFPFSNP